jgi:hypothetical protein
MAICPALRGITLIFTLLDKGFQTRRWGENMIASKRHESKVFPYLTGQVVAAYNQVRLTPPVVGSYRQDFGGPRKRDFAKLNLHLPACRSLGAGRAIFEQPGKHDFCLNAFRNLILRG